MSLILKGIDLPSHDKAPLNFVVWSDGTVYCKDVSDKITKVKAIQIPKGHGRLIDADKLRDEFSRTESGYCGGWEFCDKPEDFQFLIDDEPTILEAEGEV